MKVKLLSLTVAAATAAGILFSSSESKAIEPGVIIAAAETAYGYYTANQEKRNAVTRADIDLILSAIQRSKQEILDKIDDVRDKEWLRAYDAQENRFASYATLRQDRSSLWSFISEGYGIHSQLEGIVRDERPQSAEAVAVALNMITLIQAVALIDYHGGDRAMAHAFVQQTLRSNEILLGLPTFPESWSPTASFQTDNCQVLVDLFRIQNDGPYKLYQAIRPYEAGYHKNDEFRYYRGGAFISTCRNKNPMNRIQAKNLSRQYHAESVQLTREHPTFQVVSFVDGLLRSM